MQINLALQSQNFFQVRKLFCVMISMKSIKNGGRTFLHSAHLKKVVLVSFSFKFTSTKWAISAMSFIEKNILK